VQPPHRAIASCPCSCTRSTRNHNGAAEPYRQPAAPTAVGAGAPLHRCSRPSRCVTRRATVYGPLPLTTSNSVGILRERYNPVELATFTESARFLVTTVRDAPGTTCAGNNYNPPNGCPGTQEECTNEFCLFFCVCLASTYYTMFHYGTSNGQTSHIPYFAFPLPVVSLGAFERACMHACLP